MPEPHVYYLYMPKGSMAHSLKEKAKDKGIGRRHLIWGVVIVIALAITSLYLVNLSPYRPAASGTNQIEYIRAKVLSVSAASGASGGQTISVKIIDGQNKGETVSVNRSYILGDPNSERLPLGSQVLLIKDPNNGDQYSYFDRYRIPGAVTLSIILLVLVLAIGRWRGLTGAIGLVISITVLVTFVLPRIVNGHAPFATCVEGAFVIAILSIWVAHGFSKRTTIALVSVLITLLLMVGLVAASVHISGITGDPGDAVNIEQQTSLLNYAPRHIDLAGLLMGGMVIASLGVLEDITTAQAAAVDEIHKANPKRNSRQLYHSGLSVGREHIASLINTLVLVYFGVALPTIVLTVLYSSGPFLVMINNETVMEAIIRAGVSSIALLLAVPLSTGLAAYLLPRWLNPD